METIEHLENAGVAYCGAARDRERAWEPRLMTVERTRLGFISCTDLSFEHGSMCKVGADLDAFKARIAQAQAQCELLIVSVHWGHEYEKRPTERQQTVARAAIDAGANLIIGHHPHTLQGVGRYRGAPILYSCGNFVFDQREGERMKAPSSTSPGMRKRVGGSVWRRCGFRTGVAPIYPDESAAAIINRLATLSGNLGVSVTVQGTEGFADIAGADAPEDGEDRGGPDAPPPAEAAVAAESKSSLGNRSRDSGRDTMQLQRCLTIVITAVCSLSVRWPGGRTPRR